MTKKYAFAALFGALLLIGSCSQATNDSDRKIESGDLLFVSLPMNYWADEDYSSSAEEENYIHTAILENSGDTIYVIDATIKRGVARYPLDTFLVDFSISEAEYPKLEVKRLKDNREAADYVENAKQFLGLPYDVDFDFKNEAMYCTELVRDSYVSAAGDTLFTTSPVSFYNSAGEIPVYWIKIFEYINREIPYGQPGILPKDLYNSELLRLIPEK